MTLSIYDSATFLPETLKKDVQEYCANQKNSFCLDTSESLPSDKFDKMFSKHHLNSKQSHGNKNQSHSSPFENFGKNYCKQFPSKPSKIDWSTDVLEYLVDEQIQRNVGQESNFSFIDFRLPHEPYSRFSKNSGKWSFCCNHSQQLANSECQSNFSGESHKVDQALGTESPSKKIKSSLDDAISNKNMHALYKKNNQSKPILALQTKLSKKSLVCRKFAKIATKISGQSNLTIRKSSPKLNEIKDNQLETLGNLKVSNRPDIPVLLQASGNLQVADFVAGLSQVETSIFYPRQLTNFEHPYLVTTESNMRSVIRVETKAEKNSVLAQHENDQKQWEKKKHDSSSESSVAQTLTPTSFLSLSQASQATSEMHGVRLSRTRRYLSHLKHAIADRFTLRKKNYAESFVETLEPSIKDDIIKVKEKIIAFDSNSYSNIDQWLSLNETLEDSMKQAKDGAPFVHPFVLRFFASLGFVDYSSHKALLNKTNGNELLEEKTLKSFPKLKNCVNTFEKRRDQNSEQENCNENNTTMWSMFFWKLLLHFPQSSYICCKDCGDTIASNWDCIEFRKQLNDYTNRVCNKCLLIKSEQKWVRNKEKNVRFLSKCLY